MTLIASSWLWLLGIDPSQIPDQAEVALQFMRSPAPWMLVPGVLIVMAAVWLIHRMYRSEISPASRPIRIMLTAVRVAILLLLCIILLGPGLSVTIQRVIEPIVIVMVDSSSSMSIEDRYRNDELAGQLAGATGQSVQQIRTEPESRLQRVRQMLNQPDWWDQLNQRGDVHLMHFDRTLSVPTVLARTAEEDAAEDEASTPPAWSRWLNELEADGPVTDLNAAIEQAIRAGSDRPLAGIVIISDGQANTGQSLDAAMQQAQTAEVPIFTVPIGDTHPAMNLKLAEVRGPDRVFRADPMTLEATVTGESLDSPTSLRVTLHAQPVDTEAAEQREIDAQSIELAAGDSQQTIRFEVQPDEAGLFKYALRVESMPGELTELDNTDARTIEVLSDQVRVLLVAGGPSWEYRTLQTLFRRDPTVELSAWLQSLDPKLEQEGDISIDQLPRTEEQLYEYDAVILIDPDPGQLDHGWFELLGQFVDQHGGGVMFIAGPTHSHRLISMYRRPLMRLLPIDIGDLSAADVQSLMVSHAQRWPLQLTPDGRDHPICRLHPEPTMNQRIWDELPGFFWSMPARRAKPAATVIMEHPSPTYRVGDDARPLLVVGQHGPGRVIYMGFGGTWRWRGYGTNAEFFDTFWIQNVRYLVEGRLLGSASRLQLSTDRERYELGEVIRVRVEARDAQFEPLELESLEARLQQPDGLTSRFRLTPDNAQPGIYQATLVASSVGPHAIELTTPPVLRDLMEQNTIRKAFQVQLADLEFAALTADRQALTQLARQTGGQVVAINQLASLPAMIPDRRLTQAIPARPITLWDTWLVMLILVALLTVEWAVRRAVKML